MMKKKFLVFAVVSMFLLTCFMSSLTVESTGDALDVGVPEPSLYNNGSHIIEGVPYVAQSNDDFYCNYASCAMVLQYHGLNVTLFEVIHNAGLGYSFAARPRIIPTPSDDFKFPIGFPRHFRCWSGQETSFGEEDAEFIAGLYGLECEFIYPEVVINKEKCWREYWSRVKNYILQDLPVCTNVDFTILPYYVNLWNLSGRPFHYSHNIVIVGFDEDNGTVYYNDALCAALTSAEDGTYAPVSIDAFKKAVQSVHWLTWNGWEEGYTTVVFRKIKEPLSRETIFTKAHERNIRRMSGDPSAYDKQNARENFCKFGITALEAMRDDFSRPEAFLVMPMYPFKTSLIDSYFFAALEKYNVSQYLKNLGFSPVSGYDAALLEAEAMRWDRLQMIMLELINISATYGYFKSVILSIPLLHEIIHIIDEIISIEEAIIKGPV